ncbi:multisubunit potassium/proton antiporter, PhaG subunit [Sphingomonas laterariae]|uniref:Multisubunit potassium/proton antiporter, PhaG subunit n=1 Tax=Edaphosphingomonas laterariae TaxID=861865 RepID=A0A239K1A2_9SPHN|nr:monovalent cation/H(+) antiporter subunit G [Sphingomonas laterariae]SNT12096.1 multisubunit potassium/proton antiporter, PhaG subunit [Sphingomonas laterariae]
MIQAPDLPLWAAIVVGVFVLLGASITLIGALGLLRLNSFYDRVHAPTLGPTLGTACILVASITCFSVLQSRPVVHEILIAIFVTVTTPVTLMLLARAALYRDRRAGVADVPKD